MTIKQFKHSLENLSLKYIFFYKVLYLTSISSHTFPNLIFHLKRCFHTQILISSCIKKNTFILFHFHLLYMCHNIIPYFLILTESRVLCSVYAYLIPLTHSISPCSNRLIVTESSSWLINANDFFVPKTRLVCK